MEADNSYELSGTTRYFSNSRMKFNAYEKFHIHCLKELDVSDCHSLRLLPSIGKADRLKSLSVNNFGKLVFPMHQCYPSLESLCIRSSFDSRVLSIRIISKAESS